ncbi:MAG: DUF1403 family protein [Dechloromonas sp.]|nr:MAG: DUF1403 family protein [Dechloromonas sp.]
MLRFERPSFLKSFLMDLPYPPSWLRSPGAGDHELDAACVAGAALALFHGAAGADLPGRGVWLDRQALRAAVFCCAAAGRREGEPDIRDAVHMTPTGENPGPAGRLYGFWREAARRSPELDDDKISAGRRLLGLSPSTADDLVAIARELAAGDRVGMVAAVELTARFATLPAEAEPFALWLADIVLARRSGWPITVPLFACALQRPRGGVGRLVRQEPDTWRREVLAGIAAAALEGLAHAQDLAARARRLAAAVPRLRAKGAEPLLAALLERDAVAPATPMPTMTARSRRRLFDRLVGLGLVRELTGRPTFRLYGL